MMLVANDAELHASHMVSYSIKPLLHTKSEALMTLAPQGCRALLSVNTARAVGMQRQCPSANEAQLHSFAGSPASVAPCWGG